MNESKQKSKKISPVRKDYTLRLIFRIFIFIACLAGALVKPKAFAYFSTPSDFPK